MELKKTILIGTIVGLIALSLVGTGAGEVYVVGGNWEYETIDTASGSAFGYRSSIGVGADNNIAIIHGDYNLDRLRLTHWNGTGWESEYISENNTAYSPDDFQISAAWDSNGIAHAASVNYSQTGIFHTYWNGTGWETENISATGCGMYTAIAIDSNEYPHIVYFDSAYDDVGGGSPYGLIYAAWNGASWDIESIDANSDGEEYIYPSIAIDSNDKPHISYIRDTATDPLWYGEKTGVSWVISQVITDRRCNRNDIALDSNDKPHIAFSDWTNLCLGYVEKTGSSWDETYIDCGRYGWSPSITLDEYDYSHIAYINDSSFNANLRYATYDGYNWYGEIVDDTQDTLWYGTDIIIHNETVHISYQRYRSDQGLKYATYNLTYMEWEESHGIYGNVYLLPLYSEGRDTDITCKNDTFNTSTITDDTGYYIFDNLDIGNYWINASLYNYIDNSALVEVVEGYNQTLLDGCDAL